MGCCAALELADRGASVTLFEATPNLLGQASAAGEAKIHLGYVYAHDRTRETTRLMIRGALAFSPFFRRHLGGEAALQASRPFYYAVHRDTMVPAAEFADHLRATSDDVREIGGSAPADYFGRDPATPPRQLSDTERGSIFDPTLVAAAFETEEIALATGPLYTVLRQRLTNDPNIEVRLESPVQSVADNGQSLSVQSGSAVERFDHVLNASWAGRLAIDAAMGMLPSRRWLFRYKHGIHLPAGTLDGEVVSVTISLGPFGDCVSYADGGMYLSWYPVCMTGQSGEISPPDWLMTPGKAERDAILHGSVEALAALVPGLQGLDREKLARAQVMGGVIYALGKLDIDRHESELHCRDAIGLTSKGRYHTVDTGKLTMAPWFAERCAERILG